PTAYGCTVPASPRYSRASATVVTARCPLRKPSWATTRCTCWPPTCTACRSKLLTLNKKILSVRPGVAPKGAPSGVPLAGQTIPGDQVSAGAPPRKVVPDDE